MKKKWVSELIGTTYQEWIKGQMVFIRCHTGAGKTFFVVNILMQYLIKNKKTLAIYVSRRTLYEKYQKDIVSCALQNGINLADLEKYIKIYTYQSMATLINKGIKPEIADYTCMDEFHYFNIDGKFAAESEAVYQCFIEMQPQTVCIGISATGERTEMKFVKDLKLCHRYTYSEKGMIYHKNNKNLLDVRLYPRIYDVYELKADYSYLDIFYLSDNFDVSDVIQKDLKNKWLILVPSIKMGHDFYKKLVEANVSVAFLCSENMDTEKEIVQSITSMEKFTQTVLISTQVIDTGINLADYKLKNVILISDVRENFIQLLGRKRIMTDKERVNLYIPQLSVSHFEKRISSLSAKLDKFTEIIFGKISTTEELVSYFKIHGYDSDIISMLYFCNNKMSVSATMLVEFEYQRNEYKRIAANMTKDEDYFIKLQLSWMGFKEKAFDSRNYVEYEIRENALKEFIDIVENEVEKGARYSVQEGKSLVLERLQKLAAIYDREFADKRTFSVKSFNAFCQKYHLPYICDNKKGGEKNKVQYVFQRNDAIEE